MKQASNQGALSHIRILDLTTFLSGPFASQILGDLGAEIIKVEQPEGDMTRKLPPHFVGDDSVYYLSVNRNKQSLVIDLRSEAGRERFIELAGSVDAVVENLRPGSLRRLGIELDDLMKKNPRLIWCSISGFGQDGPYRDRPAFDMIVQAQSGGMSITGEPEGRPVRAGIPIGDLSAGHYGVIGLLAALEARRETGKGQVIDISMLDCQIAMLTYQGAYHLHSGIVPGRQGAGHDSFPTYRTFIAKDQIEIAITANTDRMWQSLCDALGVPEMGKDERYVTTGRRYLNRHQLWETLGTLFRQRSAAEWVEILIREGVPAAVVNTLDRAFDDPQVKHRGMIMELEDAAGHKIRVPGNPIKMSRSMREKNIYPPRLDEHDVE